MEKEPLHELIKSMSPAEKGYFKKLVQAGEDTNYIRLFDAINKQEKYDAQNLKKLFSTEKFMSNFSVTKQYLTDVILKSLRSYNAQNSKEFELDEYLQNLKILYNKAQYDLCDKLLIKAKQMATDHELYHHLLRLYAFEHTFNQFKMKNNIELFDEESRILERLKNTCKVNKAYISTLEWVQKNDRARNADDLEQIKKLRGMEGFNVPFEELSFHALNSYFAGETIYHYIISEDKLAADFKIRQLENYIANPRLREMNTKNFLLVYGNVLTLLYNAGDKERFIYYYNLLAKYHHEIKEHEYTRLEQTLAFGMCFYNMTKNYGSGSAFAESNLQLIDGKEEKVSKIRLKDFYLNAAIFCIYEGEFRKALQWIIRLKNNSELWNLPYYHIPARLIEIIIHVELGNEDLIVSMTKHLYKKLYSAIDRHEFEEIILKNLQRILKAKEKKVVQSIFATLQHELEEIKKNPLKSRAMEHFDYVAWLERKAR
jgi:hypothetical protein